MVVYNPILILSGVRSSTSHIGDISEIGAESSLSTVKFGQGKGSCEAKSRGDGSCEDVEAPTRIQMVGSRSDKTRSVKEDEKRYL